MTGPNKTGTNGKWRRQILAEPHPRREAWAGTTSNLSNRRDALRGHNTKHVRFCEWLISGTTLSQPSGMPFEMPRHTSRSPMKDLMGDSAHDSYSSTTVVICLRKLRAFNNCMWQLIIIAQRTAMKTRHITLRQSRLPNTSKGKLNLAYCVKSIHGGKRKCWLESWIDAMEYREAKGMSDLPTTARGLAGVGEVGDSVIRQRGTPPG
eukprot:5678121-Amphidinium_carterae.1